MITDIAFKQISGVYYYGAYGPFKVIMNIETGYINATHLCAQAKTKNGGRKELFNWRRTEAAEALLNEASAFLDIYKNDLLTVVTGGQITEIRGTYAHPDLIPHIASWASPKFAVAVMRIVNEYIIDREVRKRTRLAEAAKLPTLGQIVSVQQTRDSISSCALPEVSANVGCVYLITDGTHTKIGWTCNLPERLSCLQTANANELRVAKSFVVEYPSEQERILHEKFANKRVRGEWFNLSEEDVQSIEL